MPPLILNVDDDDAKRRYRTVLLEQSGFEVIEAPDGTTALAKAAVRPNLVLLDVLLPRIDGLDVCRRLKTDDHTSTIPVLLISAARVDTEDSIRGLAAGADWYLIEPVEPDTLVGVIQALLRRHDVAAVERSERNKAEDELRLSETRFRLLVDRAPYGIFRASLDGRFQTANPAIARILGFETVEPLLACCVQDFYVDPIDGENLIEACTSVGALDNVELHWKTRDGRPLTIRWSGRVIYDDHTGAEVIEAFVEDVTARLALEGALRQAQKMEAVGHLAGGVAHDFNNLLTAILGYSEMMLSQIGEDKPISSDLHEIRNAALRAASLTKQLLAFSRKQPLSLIALDLNAVVRESFQLLQRLIGEQIRLETTLQPRLQTMMGDATQLEQVLLNLVLNARDAMAPSGGEVRIETKNVVVSQRRLVPGPVRIEPGRYVALTVRDAGRGMDEATRARLFEPFFTTKSLGNGTGLGLAVVHGIVNQLGGYIWAETAVGRGTTFCLYFPAASAAPSRRTAPSTRLDALIGRETVLVVEDENAVRQFASIALRRYGYQVLEAESPEEAMRVVAAHEGIINLIVSDVIMPEMSGPELMRRLRAVRPGTPAVLMSGYTADQMATTDLEPADVLMLKPFTTNELLSRVRETLDARRAADEALQAVDSVTARSE